jgi:hypothetical protein
MTLFTPWLTLGRNTLYTSTIVNGDLDSAAKVQAINTAIAEAGVQTVVFDRGYNLTLPRSAPVGGSASNLFIAPSGRRIIGDPTRPIDMSMMDTANVSGTQRFLFSSRATEGAAVNLTADVDQGEAVITVGPTGMATLGLQIGDNIRLMSDKLFIAGGTVGAEEQGEILTVMSVGSESFGVLPAVQDSYATSDTARVYKLSMVKGLVYEGLRGIGPGMLNNGASAVTGDRMFHVVGVDRLAIRDCASDFFDNGNYLYSCIDGSASNFKAIFETTNALTRGQNQYGLCFVNACQDFIIDSAYVIGSKHGIVQSESGILRGVTRRVTVRDSIVIGAWNFGIATHTNGEKITVHDNELDSCNAGIEAGCREFISRNNIVRFAPGATIGIGVGVTDIPENIVSDGDRVYGGNYGFRLSTTAFPPFSGTVGPFKITVKNFYAERFALAGIQMLSALTGPFYNFEMSNIETYQAGQSSSGITSATSININGPFNRVRIDGANLMAASTNTSACILTSGITDGRVSNVNYNRHAAPILGGTDVTSSNISGY